MCSVFQTDSIENLRFVGFFSDFSEEFDSLFSTIRYIGKRNRHVLQRLVTKLGLFVLTLIAALHITIKQFYGLVEIPHIIVNLTLSEVSHFPVLERNFFSFDFFQMLPGNCHIVIEKGQIGKSEMCTRRQRVVGKLFYQGLENYFGRIKSTLNKIGVTHLVIRSGQIGKFRIFPVKSPVHIESLGIVGNRLYGRFCQTPPVVRLHLLVIGFNFLNVPILAFIIVESAQSHHHIGTSVTLLQIAFFKDLLISGYDFLELVTSGT